MRDNQENENKESQLILWETIRDATLVHLRQARAIYLSDKSLRGGITNFLRVYAPMEPQNTSFIESIKKMAELFIEVKKKYDETIYEWLNLAVKHEGESASKKWKDIAVKELEAELPNTIIVNKETG